MKRAVKRAQMRDLCNQCKQRPKAVNYYKEGKIFYRSKCDHCSRGYVKTKPLWRQHGYQKKNYCEKCNYTSRHEEQFDVYFVDGNLQNIKFTNLKTVCANCQRVLQKEGIKWRQGDLKPDF